MKPILFSMALLALSTAPALTKGEETTSPTVEEIQALQESVMNLEDSLADIQIQYQELFELLSPYYAKSQVQLTNFSSLFQEASTNSPIAIQGNTITIRDDASIYLGDQKLLDVIKSWTDNSQTETQKSEAGLSSMSGASLMANISYVTRSEFQNLSGDVIKIGPRITTVEKDIKTISSSIEEIKKSADAADKNLAEKIGKIESDVLKINERISGIDKADKSPVSVPTPPTKTATLLKKKHSGSSFCSTFSVTEKAKLKSISLYCDNKNNIVPARNVCIFADNVDCSPAYAQKTVLDDAKHPKYLFSTIPATPGFDNILDLKPGIKYYIVVTTANPYVTGRYRGEGLIGASLLSYSGKYSLYKTTSDKNVELWSEIEVQEAEIALGDNGIDVNYGGVRVDGSEVITENTLRNAVKTELKTASGAFKGNLTYDMFNDSLKNMFLKISGGTMEGPLTVSDLTIENNGSWQIGTKDQRSDIILKHPKAAIVSDSGDITIAAQKGDIKLDSFASFATGKQCGTVKIKANSSPTSAVLIVSGISENARAILTPRQDTGLRYWVTYSNGSLWLKYSSVPSTDMAFDYLIISK